MITLYQYFINYTIFFQKGFFEMSKVLGIIAEYNPFHNGHLYHLQQSLKSTGSSYSIAVISGNFTQRGSTSLINKWDKAKIALQNGIDLVIFHIQC